MRKTQVTTGVIAAALIAAIAFDTPSLQATSVAPAGPLRALSEQDMSSTRESGCTCMFNKGRSSYIQMIGNEFMVRTGAGRQVCRITDRQFGNFSQRRPIACGGWTFTLRHTGRTISHPEADSAETPSALTMVRGRTRFVVNGTWGCAC